MINKIDKSCQKLIDDYKTLKIGNKCVTCPYHLNPKSSRANLRVLVGKGSPEELELETQIYLKLGGYDPNKLSEKEIREFMKKRHLGIDCSGYLVHILDALTMKKYGTHIWSFIHKEKLNLYDKIRFLLRPVENISVQDLTSSENSVQIKNVNDIQVGDMIRTNGLIHKDSNHILLVIEVARNEDESVKSFTYTNSNKYYGDNNGIRDGKVLITNASKGLEFQEWQDKDENGRNFVLESYAKEVDQSGIFRLKILDKDND